jgi:hypothetical protein
MHRRFGLAQLCQQLVALGTGPHYVGLLTDSYRPFYNAILKGSLLFETTPLDDHGAPLHSKAGTQPGAPVTDKSHEPGCDGLECALEDPKARVNYFLAISEPNEDTAKNQLATLRD